MQAPEALGPGDPERLGPYLLSGRLGAGGQGVVYAGEAAQDGRVAVKLLRTGFGDDPEARARFIRELDTAKRVARFCTAAVLDADVAGDRPYIVSEYVDGPSLHRVVTGEGPRSGGTLERLAVGTATALVAIHQAGVVHRDFKPHNVLLGPDGPRVIDFGVARALDGTTITSSGVLGTPAYMAPEQFAGERAGPAADVFAWAATLVFASSGRPPFGDDTMTAVVTRIVQDEPDLGGLDGPLRDLAARCLAKDPAGRPAASEVLRTLLGEQEPGVSGTMPASALHGAAAAGGAGGQGGARQHTLVNGQVPFANRASGPAQAPPQGSAPARRRSGVVAVSAAVVAVAAAVAVTVVALGGRDGGKGPEAQVPPPATPTASPSASASPSESPTRTRTPSPKPPPSNVVPPALAGTWKGRLRQNDGKTLTVVLTLPAKARQGRIAYPDQGCGGVETVVGNAGGRLMLSERITQRPDKCVDTGTVTVFRRGPGTIMFNYTGTEKGSTWTVAGPMTRS